MWHDILESLRNLQTEQILATWPESHTRFTGDFTTSECSCSCPVLKCKRVFGRIFFPLIFTKNHWIHRGKKMGTCKRSNWMRFWERSEPGLHDCFCGTRFYPQSGTAASEFLEFPTKEALSSKTQTKDFYEIVSKMYFSSLSHSSLVLGNTGSMTSCYLES